MVHFLVRRLVPEGAAATDTAVRQRCGTASGGIGVGLNLLLCAGKFTAGLVTGSISILADAFNNLTDAGSSIVTLIGFRLAGQKPDQDHPFGHGRMEYLSGLIIALLILLVGFELGKSSVEKILHPEEVVFSALSAGILAVSVCVKLWMFLFNRALSRRIDSTALSATAADSLADAVTTTVVLAGLFVGKLTGLHIDGWLGVAVAVFILRSGVGTVKDTLDPLLGQPPEPALVQGIQDTVLAHPEVVGLHDLIVHDYGPGRRLLSLHAEVPADADIMAAHDVIDHIERELHEKYAVEAVIHMDPILVGDETTDRLRQLVTRRAREIDPDVTIHDFRITDGPRHTNLIFDMVVPHSCPLTEEELKEQIAQAMKQEDERYFTVVEIDRPYVSR
jgi:cation diffusion facilitator family transporter